MLMLASLFLREISGPETTVERVVMKELEREFAVVVMQEVLKPFDFLFLGFYLNFSFSVPLRLILFD